MYSTRYGSLRSLAAKTSDRCHLCHDDVDILNYGRPGTFGRDTVTVDHLWPQAFGGDDGEDNLLVAHAGCNSYRGVRDVEDVRMELAGTTRAPLSENAQVALTIGGTALAGWAGGRLFAREVPDGRKEFNQEAAVATGLAAFLLLLAAA